MEAGIVHIVWVQVEGELIWMALSVEVSWVVMMTTYSHIHTPYNSSSII